jgi:hypothetical protein
MDERYGEGSIRRWCEFNTSVLIREGMRCDKALSEDEAEIVSLYCSMGRKSYTARRRDDIGRRRDDTGEGKRDETTLISLTQILLGRKIKKIHVVDSTSINKR